MTDARWARKADALLAAWQHHYGSYLAPGGVALGLGPAQLETRCGDAWPGPDGLVDTEDDENNWGACTLRSLTGSELAVLASRSISPSIGPGHVEIAKRAMAALAEAGIPVPSGTVGNGTIPVPRATIHCDSRTVKDANGKAVTIPHFVWFANFATPEDGAAYYLHLLGGAGRAELAKPGTVASLAAAMYARGYFGGFHPHAIYTAADGTQHDGNRENIAAYAKLIDYWLPIIRAGLVGWTPIDAPTLPAPPALPATVPPPIPLEVDWDELRKDRDAMIKDDDEQ
jgi:hypothetical protein